MSLRLEGAVDKIVGDKTKLLTEGLGGTEGWDWVRGANVERAGTIGGEEQTIITIL